MTNLPVISAAGLFQTRQKFSDPVRYPDNTISKLRTVLDYELELFTEDGGISHVNGCSYPIRRGALLLAQPGDKRQSTLHFTALYLHFGTSDPAIRDLLHFIHGFHYDMGYEKLLPALQDICETALSFESDSAIRAAAKLISFLCDVKRNCIRKPCSQADAPSCSAISKAIDYMKKNYTENLTIQEIAGHCCLSPSHFHKQFMATAHVSPYQYLLGIRLSAAKALLASTSLSISEIADKCGFNSQTYFSDCFKKQTGVTPKEFRHSYDYPPYTFRKAR